ncbi:hypothetical protein FHG87_010198 [Trinorchestia longiramus]|nr:hypothetical protein FHG87_010198 [Trinorchestia longiramus]
MAASGVSDSEASTDSLPSVTADDCSMTSDEETWLFASPRTPAHSLEWLRKDIDDPSLLTVRRSLLHKLDEIANTPRATPQTTPYDTPKHTPKHTPNDTPRQTPDLSSSSANTSAVVTPDSPPHRGEIDTRTFVRPRKKKVIQPEIKEEMTDENRSPVRDVNRENYGKSPHRGESNGEVYNNDIPYDINALRYDSHNSRNMALRNQMQQKACNRGSALALSSGSLGSEEDEHLSSASESSYCKIADVEDVNTLARLQEESLKLPDSRTRAHEENAKLASARSKMSRLPAPRSGRTSAGSSQEDLLGNPAYRHSSPRRPSDTWSGLSPPVSPYTSNMSLNATNGGTNGLRLPGSYANSYGGQCGSPAGSRGGSPAREMQARKPGSRLVAPQVRGVVRSDRSRMAGIPRPAGSTSTTSPLHRASPGRAAAVRSAGRAPRVTPTAAALPAPQLVHKPQQRAADWREGCY